MEMIYQICTHPIKECNFITANDYEDSWFVPAVAEYARECDNRQSVICVLMNMLEEKKIAVTDQKANSFVFLPNMQSRYFEGRFGRFRKLLAELSRVQEPKFIYCQDEIEGLLIQLSSCFSEHFGAYVAGDGDELITLDEFIRAADEGITYYIGGVVSYHI